MSFDTLLPPVKPTAQIVTHDKYGGRLPVHVRLILDEFANIGQIPNFDKLIYLSSLRRKRRRVVTEDEPFDLYDIELSDEDFTAE